MKILKGQAFAMKQFFYIVFATPIKILEFCRNAEVFFTTPSVKPEFHVTP